MIAGAAIVGSLMCAASLVMQIGLMFGAPWGEYANGGKFPGKLPVPMRFAAALQGAILIFIALALLDAAGLIELQWPQAAFWVALAISAITCVLNWITPSKKERRLWGPTTSVLLISALIVFLMPTAQAASAEFESHENAWNASASAGEYACPNASTHDVYLRGSLVRGKMLQKLTGGTIALYPFAPPADVMKLEWANLFGAGYRAGDIYFFESTEGRHELVHIPTNTRVDCVPNPDAPRAIQKRPLFNNPVEPGSYQD